LPPQEVTVITVMGVTDMKRPPGHCVRGFQLQPDAAVMTRRPAHTRHLVSNGMFENYASRTFLRMYLRWGVASFLALGLISFASVAL
jgi:hypothetical protein